MRKSRLESDFIEAEGEKWLENDLQMGLSPNLCRQVELRERRVDETVFVRRREVLI